MCTVEKILKKSIHTNYNHCRRDTKMIFTVELNFAKKSWIKSITLQMLHYMLYSLIKLPLFKRHRRHSRYRTYANLHWMEQPHTSPKIKYFQIDIFICYKKIILFLNFASYFHTPITEKTIYASNKAKHQRITAKGFLNTTFPNKRIYQ